MGLTPLALQVEAQRARSAADNSKYQGSSSHHHNHHYSSFPASTQFPMQYPQTALETIQSENQLTSKSELLLHLSGQSVTGPPTRNTRGFSTTSSSSSSSTSTPRSSSIGKPVYPVASKPQTSNFGNDYSSYYVNSKVLPQKFVQNIESPHMGYPRLQKLHELKNEHTAAFSASPVSIRVPSSAIPSFLDTLGSSGARFDVIMIHGCLDYFPLEHLARLKIDKISAKPSLVFLWCPNSEIGNARGLLEKWGFRNAEDITYLVSSQSSPHAPKERRFGYPGNPSSKQNLFKHSTWHCLMGLRGTLRRSTDIDLIHCNVDTDVIIEKTSRSAPKQTNVVPNEIYDVIENFTSMGRKIHIVATESTEQLPVRPRPGWVVVSPDAFQIGKLEPTNYRFRTTLPFVDELENLRPRTPQSMR